MTAATQIATSLRELAPGKKLVGAEIQHIDAIAALWAARAPVAGQSGGWGAVEAGADQTRTEGRKTGDAGISLIHSFEQCKLDAYPDPGSRDGNPWTIGWGATGPGIGRGVKWTQQQCDDRFRADLVSRERQLNALLGTAPTTQHQFDALMSFGYNVGMGEGGLKTSTLLRLHKAGDYAGAEAQFARWNKNDGAVMRGLTRRRAAEAALYGRR